jgi:hypothetical protein
MLSDQQIAARGIRERRIQSDPLAKAAVETRMTSATSPRSATSPSQRQPELTVDVRHNESSDDCWHGRIFTRFSVLLGDITYSYVTLSLRRF